MGLQSGASEIGLGLKDIFEHADLNLLPIKILPIALQCHTFLQIWQPMEQMEMFHKGTQINSRTWFG